MTTEKPKPPRWAIPQEIQWQVASESVIYDIAVIGGGAAGMMAAKKGVLNNDRVLFVVGERKNESHARGLWVPKLGNTPSLTDIKRPVVAMRNEMLQSLSSSPLKDNLHLLQRSVRSISREDREQFIIFTDDELQYRARYVILATGMMDEQPHINGSIRPILSFANRQEAIYCIQCDGHLVVGSKHPMVIGHSGSAASNAILLAERYKPPTLSISTNGSAPAWDMKQNELLKRHGIKVYTEQILEIARNKEKKFSHMILSNSKKISVDFVLISLGVRVNNQLATQLGAELDSEGYVIANEDGLTSVEDLYVAGDLRSGTRKQIYVAWDTAARSADAINMKIREAKYPLLA